MANASLEELTNYMAWQMEKYGNVVADVEGTPSGELMNSGLEELNRLAEWIFHQSEQDGVFIGDVPGVAGVDKLRKEKDRFIKMNYVSRIHNISKINRVKP